MMVKKKPIYLNSTNQHIMPYTGVHLSNISNIVTQSGRPATAALRYCRPGQKTAQALVQTANPKLLSGAVAERTALQNENQENSQGLLESNAF